MALGSTTAAAVHPATMSSLGPGPFALASCSGAVTVEFPSYRHESPAAIYHRAWGWVRPVAVQAHEKPCIYQGAIHPALCFPVPARVRVGVYRWLRSVRREAA